VSLIFHCDKVNLDTIHVPETKDKTKNHVKISEVHKKDDKDTPTILNNVKKVKKKKVKDIDLASTVANESAKLISIGVSAKLDNKINIDNKTKQADNSRTEQIDIKNDKLYDELMNDNWSINKNHKISIINIDECTYELNVNFKTEDYKIAAKLFYNNHKDSCLIKDNEMIIQYPIPDALF
jgi:hypothetical protein